MRAWFAGVLRTWAEWLEPGERWQRIEPGLWSDHNGTLWNITETTIMPVLGREANHD